MESRLRLLLGLLAAVRRRRAVRFRVAVDHALLEECCQHHRPLLVKPARAPGSSRGVSDPNYTTSLYWSERERA